MDASTAILISAGLGTIGWFVTVRSTRLVDRRQHTYRVITRQHDDKRFESSLERIRFMLRKNDVPCPKNELRQDDINHIDYLLNHYEFMSAAILCGDIEEKLIKSCEFSRITKLYTTMENYINESRIHRNQPTMFENLQTITERWISNNRSVSKKLFEYIIMRPCDDSYISLIYAEWFEFILTKIFHRIQK